MSEPQTILSASVMRNLTDKLYEKRKAGALEIEKMVRDAVAQNQTTMVDRVIDELAALARSHNQNFKKGGFIGLAATAIALGKLTPAYTTFIMKPVLESFLDTDSRVRYYSCEALYNIVKMAKESVMPHFAALFDALGRAAADSDINMRSGSELLDRLLKDIVVNSDNFQIQDFVVLLCERIYTKNPNVRQFLISWVQTLCTIPDVNLVPHMPGILDGCFQILSDPTPKIRETSEAVLGEFLKHIQTNPEEADLEKMVNILILHSQAQDDLLQYISLVWLKEFLQLDGSKMLQFASGYLTAILPCLSYDDSKKSIREVATMLNFNMMKLVTHETADDDKKLDLMAMVQVLHNNLEFESVPTRVAVLRWIHHLYKKMPSKVFPHMQELFPNLSRLLSDESDDVILLDLEVLSDMCMGAAGVTVTLDMPQLVPAARESLAGRSPYFVQLLLSLLDMFKRESAFLSERGSFIIRQLCVLLKADQIYSTMAIILVHETDLQFASVMVQSLNAILLTASELFGLRETLQKLDSPEACALFDCLYRCWCHHPVAVLALCLLSQNYEHAEALIHRFQNLDITVDFLVEIDKLIQLIESPIFTFLRLQLLNPSHQKHLATVLYGILMLLPQSEAFETLNKRLSCLPLIQLSMSDNGVETADANAINFPVLLKFFEDVQVAHQRYQSGKQKGNIQFSIEQ